MCLFDVFSRMFLHMPGVVNVQVCFIQASRTCATLGVVSRSAHIVYSFSSTLSGIGTPFLCERGRASRGETPAPCLIQFSCLQLVYKTSLPSNFLRKHVAVSPCFSFDVMSCGLTIFIHSVWHLTYECVVLTQLTSTNRGWCGTTRLHVHVGC